MNHHPLLEALTYIDDTLIEVADQMPKKFHMPLPVWRAVAAVLVVMIGLSAFSGIQYIEDHQLLNVLYVENQVDYFTYDPAKLVEEADVIYEGTVIDISFIAEKKSFGQYYDIDTIYTIAVTRTYKGSTNLIEQVHTGIGLRDYKVKEQLKALQKAGAPKSYTQIPVIDKAVKPQIGSTYLFFLREWDDSPDRWGINPVQYALSGNTELESYDKYNPNVIKKYLPYVPHPLLVRTVIGGVLLAVLFAIRARIKRKQIRTAE